MKKNTFISNVFILVSFFLTLNFGSIYSFEFKKIKIINKLAEKAKCTVYIEEQVSTGGAGEGVDYRNDFVEKYKKELDGSNNNSSNIFSAKTYKSEPKIKISCNSAEMVLVIKPTENQLLTGIIDNKPNEPKNKRMRIELSG